MAVLTVAAMIAAPTLVSAQSSGSGDDQMFTSVPLCKIIDTRNWDTSQYHSGKPMAGNDYDFAIRGPSEDMSNQGGDSNGCGVPDSADLVLVNVLAAFADGGGNMKAFASNDSASNVSGSVINFQGNLNPNLNIGNAVTIPMDADTSNEPDITIRPQLNDTHIIGTVMGYYENVTDGFYTESQSDARFARKSHGHDAVESHGESTTISAGQTTTLTSATITLDDLCTSLVAPIDNWKLRIAGWTDFQDSDDVETELRLDITQDSTGDTETIGWSDADAIALSSTFNSIPTSTEVLLTDQDVDGDGTRSGIGPGDWTVDLVAENLDDDSVLAGDFSLTVSSRGDTCSSLTLSSSEETSSGDSGVGGRD